jgi:hypothetical protein
MNAKLKSEKRPIKVISLTFDWFSALPIVVQLKMTEADDSPNWIGTSQRWTRRSDESVVVVAGQDANTDCHALSSESCFIMVRTNSFRLTKVVVVGGAISFHKGLFGHSFSTIYFD